MQIPGQSAGSAQREPRGLVGGIVDRLVNGKPEPPAPGAAGLARQTQAMQGPSPAQQIAQQTKLANPALQADPGAALKARALYALGVRRSDNPAVDGELQTLMQNPPAMPLRALGQGLLVTGTVNRLLR